MEMYEKGWWIPLHKKKPTKDFPWKTKKLTADEVALRLLDEADVGVRPASLGLICVDVDRAGELPDWFADGFSYRTDKGFHYWFKYEGEEFNYKLWALGEVFHQNYVWVREPGVVHQAYYNASMPVRVDALPGIGKLQWNTDGEPLRSIEPKYSPEQSERGRNEVNQERKLQAKMRQVEALSLRNQGFTNREISVKLGVHMRSVPRLLQVIFPQEVQGASPGNSPGGTGYIPSVPRVTPRDHVTGVERDTHDTPHDIPHDIPIDHVTGHVRKPCVTDTKGNKITAQKLSEIYQRVMSRKFDP